MSSGSDFTSQWGWAQIRSLVGELGSQMPCSKKTKQTNKKPKQKQYCNKCSESENPDNSLQPHGLYGPWNSPGQNTGVGSLSLLQGIFPTQELNPGLPHCRQILYQLSHQGRPRILEWVVISSPADLPDPGIELGSPALQADSLPTEL